MGALVGAATGCGATPNSDDTAAATKGWGDVETATSPLTFAGACSTAPAHQTLTSGGSFRVTDPSYTATSCPNAYLVDLNDYATAYNFGTTIAYDETAPTTAAACRNTGLTVSVNQRAAPFFVSLGEKTAKRDLVRGPRQQGPLPAAAHHAGGRVRRRTPEQHQRLPHRHPGVQRRDRRLHPEAVRLRLREIGAGCDDDGHAYTRIALAAASSSVTGTTIDAGVHRLWQRKGTTGLSILCRSSSLEASLLAFGATSLVNAGAAASDVSRA
jgi:hypothetical protein